MIDKKIIKEREKVLIEAKTYLKTQFVGIDNIIDQFIESVRVWFLLPEVQTRPLIINLWGITGVGKTDLVRKFINFTKFSDRFCEIQLDSRDGDTKIQDYLETIFEDGNTHGVLLLDEIQRFRTVKDNGEEGTSSKYQDLWMLLSDGVFQSDSKAKNELLRILVEDDYYSQEEDDDDDDDCEEDEEPTMIAKSKKQKNKQKKYYTYYWEATRIKKLLKAEEGITEIMQWDQEVKIKRIKEKLLSTEIFEGVKYKKLLIIISGNLDEAFLGSTAVGDADRDADVYHEHSKTVNLIAIKQALKNRFKPEQIARFGNIHLIYPILNKAAYTNIIKQKIKIITDTIQKDHNIVINVDNSVYKVIYDNGVFPTQGVRPLLSTISSMFENALTTFLFEYVKTNAKEEINLSYKNDFITTTIKGKKIEHKIPRVLDDIRNNQSKNEQALFSTHEAGHAVTYVVLTHIAPTQISSNTTNYNNGGFIGTHGHLSSISNHLNDIKILLSGRIAEEIIFGKTKITSGASFDYTEATEIACNIVRMWGMNNKIGVIEAPLVNKGDALINILPTDTIIEEILKKCYKEAEEILNDNLPFLYTVINHLIEHSAISPEVFVNIANNYIKEEITTLSAQKQIEENYYEILQNKLIV